MTDIIRQFNSSKNNDGRNKTCKNGFKKLDLAVWQFFFQYNLCESCFTFLIWNPEVKPKLSTDILEEGSNFV